MMFAAAKRLSDLAQGGTKCCRPRRGQLSGSQAEHNRLLATSYQGAAAASNQDWTWGLQIVNVALGLAAAARGLVWQAQLAAGL